ncbi:unnamed protein product, partial [marine sediment metagenome]
MERKYGERRIVTRDDIKFKCINCSSSCCVKTNIDIGNKDILNLVLRLKRGIHSIIDVFEDDNEIIGHLKRKLVVLNEKEIVPACAFLKIEKDGKNLCGIFPHWPTICSLYPYGTRLIVESDEKEEGFNCEG